LKIDDSNSVAVVIPCFRQVGFLPDAIESALSQAVAPNEIIVVDDGNEQDLSAIASEYPLVRFVRQENRGLAAARNRGLNETSSGKVIFLDADDSLLEGAVEAGLRCFGANPAAAFVYGGFEETSREHTQVRFTSIEDRLDLLRCNWVAMIGTVMFDRTILLENGGFDETLGMCEDWDAYLRLSRTHPFAAHDETVARYRKHDANMSADETKLRWWIDEVRRRECERGLNPSELRAWSQGPEVWDRYYPAPGRLSRPERIRRKLSRALRI